MLAINFFPQELLDEFSIEEINRLQSLEISGLSIDTRTLKEGDFFIATDGYETTGALFLEEAFKRGAKGALISHRGSEQIASHKNLLKSFPVWMSNKNPSLYVGEMAARFYTNLPKLLMAVTGTNGKTSVSFFAHQIMRGLGYPAAFLGTTGLWKGEKKEAILDIKLTSPDAITLHKILTHLSLQGIQSVALEASSHGLDQNRLKGTIFKSAAFTNFSQDHLDYHLSMTAYFEAKCRLFKEILGEGETAVLNADIEEIGILTQIARERSHRILTYGWKGDDIRLLNYHPQREDLEITVKVWGVQKTLVLPLIGDYQVHNVLCALGLVLGALQVSLDDTNIISQSLEILKTLKAPPGRLEKVGETRTKARIYVDYAHTPDAFERVLKTLRPFTEGHLWILFGCGGDRDRQKRALMGKMAFTYADYVVITDDNPRSENPQKIRENIQEDIPPNAPHVFVIEDREKAIEDVLKRLQEGDVLLLAGKGHETGQIIGSTVHPFNDKNVTLALLEKIGS